MNKPTRSSRKHTAIKGYSSHKKKKPLKIDCTSLLNHLKLIQKSILPQLRHHSSSSNSSSNNNSNNNNEEEEDAILNEITKKIHNAKPNIQMLNFQSAIPNISKNNDLNNNNNNNNNNNTNNDNNASNHGQEVPLQDWYILVASTPFAISAQLVSIPGAGAVGTDLPPDIIIPDLIHCTPISVWTCNESGLDENIMTTSPSRPLMESGNTEEDGSHHAPSTMSASTSLMDQTTNVSFEILSCNPQIVIQEPLPLEYDDSDYLKVAVVCGTDQNRVLSVQLSIISYIGMQGCEGRFVLTKSQRGEGIVEPLILDKSGMIKRKYVVGGTGSRSGSGTGSGTTTEPLTLHPLNPSILSNLPQDDNDDDGIIDGNISTRKEGSGDGTGAGTGAGAGSRSHMHHYYTASVMDVKDDVVVEWVPFCPRGGVQSISSVYTRKNPLHIDAGNGGGGGGGDASKRQDEFIWITYGDGTFVRMPKWAFFNGCWGGSRGDLSGLHRDGLDLVRSVRCKDDYHDLTFKGRLDLGDKRSSGNGSGVSGTHMVIPLPKVFPTLLSQPNNYEAKELIHQETLFPSSNRVELENHPSDEKVNVHASKANSNHRDTEYEFFEAICYRKDSSSSKDLYPSLAFYTNENQFYSTTHKATKAKDEISTVQTLIRGGTTILGGTATLAKNVFGGMMGVLGRSKHAGKEYDSSSSTVKKMDVGEGENANGQDNDIERSVRAVLFPALNRHASVLKLGSALYDDPRQIIHVAIDPLEGNLMACSDNLGRVQLIDLESKQPIRMWKGFREATCHWIQFPYSIDGKMRTVKYLAIHSKQRNVVEIYRMAYGPRVGKFDVKSDGVSLIQCPVNLAGGERYERTFELRISKGSSKSSILKEVTVFDEELIKASRYGSKAIQAKYTGTGLSPAQKRAQEGTIQMQLLKQLLAAESAVPSDLFGLYEALTQITAISDLSKALNLLATAVNLRNMGVVDSSFHSEVVLHAREQLDVAMEDPTVATSKNSHIEELNTMIDLHTQLILAYDEIHEFENSEHMNTSLETIDHISENKWVREAIAWRETFEKVTSRSIDWDIPSQTEQILTFATFAKGCLQDGQSSFKRNKSGNLIIHLCDSTRDRKQILLHMFGPLTKDVFSSKSTYQAFEHLGLIGDFDTLLKYYGEWFMSLPIAQIEKQSNGVLCPIVRWLHDMVLDYMESNDLTKKKENGEILFLETLHNFCCDAMDLSRAFLLAAVCRDAIFFATNNIEDKTYGLLTCEDCVKPWETLLRKLRVCLCMALRLNGIHIGALPITVSNVESGEVFSIYQLISHDELSMTCKNDDIIEMELSCVENPDSFYPSTADGDEPKNWKFLQLACMNHTTNFEANVESPSAKQAPLLLLCFLHFFEPVKLASHRTLILAQKWGENPHSLHLLENVLSSLRSIHDLKYLSAVCQEVWNNHIRPIYRAFLFGFHEAHELCEETFSPILNNLSWMKTVNKITLEVISLLRSTVDVTATQEDSELKNKNPQVWPPLQNDIILDNILRKSGALDDTSLESHSAVICALQLTDDLSTLPSCFPMIHDLFLRESTFIHQPLTLQPNEAQSAFLNHALRRKALLFDGNTLNYDDLDDITTLARAWGMDKSYILTEFFIVMYEQGKDDCVQHLITSTRLLEIERFQDGGMSVACVRLDAALTILKRAKKYRNILSMLDADTCEWVKEQAEINKKQRPGLIETHREDGKLISLENTQDLILRIKRMNSASRIDATALSTMCDVLLKARDVFE